jgi:hypothetical protein
MSNVYKSTVLYCRQGNHDKEYRIQIVAVVNGWLCKSQYGRRGGNLKEANPMKQPGTLDDADAVFRKLYNDKSVEYTEDEYGYRLREPAPVIYSTTASETKSRVPQSKGELAEAIVNKLGRTAPRADEVEASYTKNQRKTATPVEPKQPAKPQPTDNPTPALFAPARRKLFLEDDE